MEKYHNNNSILVVVVVMVIVLAVFAVVAVIPPNLRSYLLTFFWPPIFSIPNIEHLDFLIVTYHFIYIF